MPEARPAGSLGAWARATVTVATGGEADVPCGGCTACCRSGWFVHVAPDEVEALRRIPRALRFPAPGRPPGHVVLPHDEHGRCPMLTGTGCSIYEDRPRTCRAFDCRVFTATGLRLAGERDGDVAAVRVHELFLEGADPTDDDLAAALAP